MKIKNLKLKITQSFRLARRAKRRLAITSLVVLLIGIPIITYTLSHLNPAEAAWWNDSWAYRAAINISDHTSLENNVYLNLTGANDLDTSDNTKFQADCGDLRFTDEAGNILPYYIVSGCGTSSTVVHVQIKTFPAGAQTFYYYYGNPSAPNGFSSSDFATAATGVTFDTVGSEENAPSPAAYWKFDDGTGTTAFDSSSNQATGTLDGPTWMTDDLCISSKCLYFPGGTAGSVTASKTVSVVKSVSFWVRPASSSASMITLDGGAKSITASAGTITANGFTSPTYYVNGIATTSPTLVANQWNFITVTTGTAITASAIKIGNVKGDYLRGTMDEVKLYDFALSSDQVKANFNSRGTSHAGAVLGASDNDPSALSNGLIGYWKMDESSWTNDCSTASVLDSSGNSNNGKACPNSTGPTGGAVGKFGNAGDFDGTNDYIDAGSNVALANSSFTLSAWAKRNSSGTHDFIFGHGADEVNSQSLHFGFRSSDTFTCSFYGDDLTTAATYTDTNWHLWTCTYDTSNKKRVIYQDGIVVASDTAAANYQGSGPLYIGKLPWTNTGYWFEGTIDESRIYNRALTSADVANLYTWAPGPVGDWEFEQGTGTSVYDTSGYGNTGTWNGALGSQWMPGKIGKGGNFNGTNNAVNAGNASSLQVSGAFTVEGWFNPRNCSGGPFNVVAKNAFIVGGTFAYYLSNCGTRFGMSGLSGELSGSNLPALNTWYHFAVVYVPSTSVTMYINGAVDASTTTSVPASADPTQELKIGATWDGGAYAQLFDGKIDSVRYYNYARTPGQVVQDMNGGHPAPGSPVGSPVGHWDFDEGYGTTSNNSGNAGSVVPGTLTNMASPATTVSGWAQSGKFGKAVSFDGINDFVSIAANPTPLQITSDISISAWVNLTSNNAVHDIVAKKGASGQFGYRLSTTSGGKLQFEISSNGSTTRAATGSATLAVNKWYYVTGVFRPDSSITVYVNGQQDGQVTTSMPGSAFNSSANVNIGAENNGASNFMAGAIDEPKIFNGSLTAAQILLDYKRGSNLVLGAMSDTSQLTGGSVASNSASAEYCVPGSATSCTSPILRYDFEEGTGSTVNDTSGNNNTATWQGTLGKQWRPGKIGKAGLYNSIDNCVSNTSMTTLPTGDFTYSGWFYENTATAGVEDLINTTTSGDSEQIELYTEAGNNLRLWLSGGSVAETGAGVWTPGKWVFVTITRSGSTVQIYMNGVPTGTAGSFGTALSAQTKLYVGCYKGNTEWWNGKVDAFRIYNYARSQAQIAWDYNRGAPVAWWEMDECQGTAIHDSSGNGRIGTLSIGGSGSQTSVGTCSTPTNGTGSWYNGRTGKYNYSTSFDGNDDFISTSAFSPLATAAETTTKATWGGWFYPTTTAASKSLIEKATEFQLTTNASSQPLCGVYYSAAFHNSSAPSQALTLNSWNHILCTYDGVNINTYLNGKLIKQSAETNNITAASSILYTAETSGGGSRYSGQIDDEVIYNYTLTASQIRIVFNQGSGVRFGPVTGAP